MNFYKHHIGDYAQATAHLSFVEDAAYSRLIRKYYAEEKPLPADLKAAQRLVGARTRDEREAVETVLNEFFTLQSDGWHNKRCDDELVQWAAQAETNRRIAMEREAKKKNAKPCNDKSTVRADNENESLHESSTGTSRQREPNQNPESRIQNPEVNNTTAVNDDDGTSNSAGAIVIADWPLTDAVLIGLERDHEIPVEFSQAVFAEWRVFNVDSPPKPPSTWHSRFVQRVTEQWFRKARPWVTS